jgi:hypothetical protein
LNFYDIVTIVGIGVASKTVKKGITSYFLRDGKNFVRSSYVLRSANSIEATWGNKNEVYFTIVNAADGYRVFNELNKPNLSVKHYATHNFEEVASGKSIALVSGDEIHFSASDTGLVQCGKNTCRVERIAIFAEVKKQS